MTVCINTFQYLTLDPTQFVGFDIILGDAFLRNAYSSYVPFLSRASRSLTFADRFNYGDGVTGPFMQLVSTTTDANAALQEFQTQRAATLAKLPPAVDPASVANKEGQQSPTQTAAGSGSASGTTTSQTGSPSHTGNGAGERRAVGAGAFGALALLSGALLL